MSDEEALDLCIKVMKNVVVCFKSIEGEVLNEKHPSCHELLQGTIDKVEGR